MPRTGPGQLPEAYRQLGRFESRAPFGTWPTHRRQLSVNLLRARPIPPDYNRVDDLDAVVEQRRRAPGPERLARSAETAASCVRAGPGLSPL